MKSVTRGRGLHRSPLEIFEEGNLTINDIFVRGICNKMPKCIFNNFEIAHVKQGQFQSFQKS